MSSKPTNEEVRQQRRLKHMEAVQDKSRQMLEAVFPNPDNVPSEAYFLSGWDRFNQSLMETFGQQKDFRLAFNHGINLVIKYQKKYGWPYSPPSHLITNKPPAQLRSPKWLKSAWAFYDAYDTWLNEMGNVSGNAIDIRYQSLMLSLLCDSGQCNADVLRSFSQQLQTHEKLPLTRFSDYTFTTLTLNNEALNTNDKIKGEMVTTYQCYLSGKTLGQLKRWQKLDRSPWQAPADSKALLAAVSLGFQKNTHFPTTLKELCSCSVYWYERHRNPDLSEALLEYRVGRTHSYSLPASNIARLVAPTLNTVQSASFDDFSTDVSVKPRRKKDWSTSGVLLEQNQFIRKLKQACKPHEGGEKVSSQRVTDNLNTLLGHYQFAPWQQAFIQWLRLKSHGCAPKTVNQYMLNQVKFWCLMNTEQELASITSPPELEVIYQEQINRHPTRKSQGYYAKRLKDLHAFASPLLGLPALRNNFFHIETGQRHTRAGLIDEPLFKALLRHIHELTDLNETDRLALQTICIIAYRCGLRINELYKLQIKNREPSPTGWLEIRANRFGDNKTASGFRKVPLFPLLLTHEHTIVTNYLGKRGALNLSDSTPLLSMGTDIYRPFNTFAVSNYVAKALRAISGEEHLVFYHLRHSCFSRLQLMLEHDAPHAALPNFYPYDEKQTQKLRNLLFKKSLSNGYWEIAAFAGHESPKTTFEHYFHLSDWLSAPSDKENHEPISLKEAQSLGLCSRRQYREMAKQKEDVTLRDCVERLDNPLQIQCFSDQVLCVSAEQVPLKLPKEKEYISLPVCYRVLEAISQGESIDELVFNHRLSQTTIDKWLANAHYLKSLTVNTAGKASKEETSHNTNAGNASRHISVSRSHALVPGKLKTKKERDYVDKCAMLIKDSFGENKDTITDAMNYCLTHTSVSKSGVTFHSPSELATFIKTFQFCIPRSHWRAVKLYIHTSTIKKEWQYVLTGLKCTEEKRGTKKGRSGKGSVRLELISPSEAQYIESGAVDKYSSHLLVYLMYMSYVLISNNHTDK